MKDLFIILGDKLQTRNFEEGSILYRRLTADQVLELVNETRATGNRLMVSYD